MDYHEYKDRDDTGLIYLVLSKMNLMKDAYELVDIGYIGLINGYKTYDKNKGTLSTYLVTCIKHEILKSFVYQKAKKRQGITISLSTIINGDTELQDIIPDLNALDVDKKIFYDILYDCIASLKPAYQDVIYKHYIQELPSQEIARMYNVSTQNIVQKLASARRILKIKLKAKGIEGIY